MTCKDLILSYINSQEGFVKKVELYSVAEDWSPETVGRELRKLEEEGKIKVGYYDGKYANGLAMYAKADYVEKKPQIKVITVNGIPTAVYG